MAGWLRWIGPRRAISSIAIVVVVAVAGWWLLKPSPPDPTATLDRVDASTSIAPQPTTTAGGTVVVHVAGSVAEPGVYSLASGSRVVDAVAAAGGALPRARVDALNLAEIVRDGVQIYVPAIGEVVASAAPGAAAQSFPLNINLATVEQLDELPGVGPATANAIVTRRTEVGRFVTVDDLLDVPGLGPAKVDAIRGLVTV